MFTKLINVLNLTFAQFLILCCEIYSGFRVPKITIIIISLVSCKITFASFSSYIGDILKVGCSGKFSFGGTVSET